MFLTIHAASGLFIGSQVHAPWLAFIFGFMAHWILDLIPHGDEKIIDRTKFTETELKWKLFYGASVDTFGIVVLFFTLTSTEGMVLTSSILWGMLGAVAPDYLWGLHKVTHIRVLKPLHKIHNWFHHLLTDDLPFKFGSIIQIATLVTFILLIIYL